MITKCRNWYGETGGWQPKPTPRSPPELSRQPSPATAPPSSAPVPSTASRSPPPFEATLGSADPPPPFIQEDEMASWLHYPLDDALYRDLFQPTGDRNHPVQATRLPELGQAFDATGEPASRRAMHPPRARDAVSESPLKPGPKVVNFSLFAKPAGLMGVACPRRLGLGAGCPDRDGVESTVVGSCDTPPVGNLGPYCPESRVSGFQSETRTIERSKDGGWSSSEQHETTLVSSGTRDRKRKARESDGSESHSEDADADESMIAKEAKRPTTERRHRMTEIHNLSERRRRDRINEKMRALQELLPRCNKSDKASMLDDVIEYLKSLQFQVQMMSMGCSMPHMMYPSHHQCMGTMAMAMRMGMLAGSMRQVMPFPPVMAGFNPGAAQLYPSFPTLEVRHHMQVPLCVETEPVSGTLDPLLNPTQPTTLAEYQQYFSQFNMQVPPRVPLPSNPSSSKSGVPLSGNQ